MKRYGLFAILCLSVVLTIGLFGCATTTTSDTASPPSGTTGINVGNSGATASANSVVFTVYPTVGDQDNTALTNLLSGNFSITIKVSGETTSQNCTISSVSNSTSGSAARVSLGMTLDRSGSMSGTQLTNLATAACTFIDLMNGADELGLIGFSSTPVTVGVTLAATSASNKTTLKNHVNALTATGQTALYESMGVAVDQAILGSHTRKAVIAMTDGGENDSKTSMNTTAEVIAYAQSQNVPIYTIGLGTGISSAELVVISNATGGVYYAAPDSSDLNSLYTKISSSLSSAYTVTVGSPITLTAGNTYIITVSIQNYGGLTGSATIYLTI